MEFLKQYRYNLYGEGRMKTAIFWTVNKDGSQSECAVCTSMVRSY